MPDPFMAVDAGRKALEHRRVYRPHHFLLLREHFLGELVAVAARARIVGLVFLPHIAAMCIRSLLNFSSVEMTPRISPMTSFVPATALYQRSSGYSLGIWQSWHVARTPVRVRAMDALPVFLRDPLHRVARRSAEFIGARDMDHHLGADDRDRADYGAQSDEREHRPASTRAAQPAPRARQQARLAACCILCGLPAIAAQGFAGGGGGMLTTGTVGLKAGSRSAIWPWRAKSIDSPRMRAASCGAWNPVEFSASTKSRKNCERRCR